MCDVTVGVELETDSEGAATETDAALQVKQRSVALRRRVSSSGRPALVDSLRRVADQSVAIAVCTSPRFCTCTPFAVLAVLTLISHA